MHKQARKRATKFNFKLYVLRRRRLAVTKFTKIWIVVTFFFIICLIRILVLIIMIFIRIIFYFTILSIIGVNFMILTPFFFSIPTFIGIAFFITDIIKCLKSANSIILAQIQISIYFNYFGNQFYQSIWYILYYVLF